MKILLDECVTKHLRPHLKNNEVFTVRELQWSGIKNGELMALCVEHQFDILLTIDKNLQFQQNLENYAITIVVLNGVTSKVEELLAFMPGFHAQIEYFEKHKAYLIHK
ncbi:MAG: DUF5615 family PIN-like protein [Ginsengibacter sp.]